MLTEFQYNLKKYLDLEIYVDPINGSDSNFGTKPNLPVKTLKAACDLVPNMGTATIYLRGGNPIKIYELDSDIELQGKHIVIRRWFNFPNDTIDRPKLTTKCFIDMNLNDSPGNTTYGFRLLYNASLTIYDIDIETPELASCNKPMSYWEGLIKRTIFSNNVIKIVKSNVIIRDIDLVRVPCETSTLCQVSINDCRIQMIPRYRQAAIVLAECNKSILFNETASSLIDANGNTISWSNAFKYILRDSISENRNFISNIIV